MTTIAYRNGELAADTSTVAGGTRCGRIVKIVRGKRGELAAACGGATYNAAFLRWVRGGRRGNPPKTGGDNSGDKGAVFFPNRRIEVFEGDGSFAFTADYYAIGSGRCEALGAMFVGASASLAVRASIAHDVNTHGEVVTLRHRCKK